MELNDTMLNKTFVIRESVINPLKKDITQFGLTHENFVTLHFICEHPGLTQSELAKVNFRDSNVVGKAIDKFEKMEMARRVRGDSDRRTFCVYPTEKGVKTVEKIWKMAESLESRQLSCLDESERTQLFAILDKIIENLK